MCHEEVPFAAPGAPYENYPVFSAPPAIAGWIGSMGWDAVHDGVQPRVDQGYDGLVRTADLLERAGVGHVGTFRTAGRAAPAGDPHDAAGVRIGVVPAPSASTASRSRAAGRGRSRMWDARNLIAQARAARKAGADIVIVKYHGGTEYDALPSAAAGRAGARADRLAATSTWSPASTPTWSSRSPRSTASGSSTGSAT